MASKKFGKLYREPDGYKVVFERYLPYDAMTVWDAITNPRKLAIWFLEVEMELKPGSRMVLTFPDENRTKTYGKVVTVVPGKLFEFIWENTDGPDEFARWEIFSEGNNKCRLVLTYSRLSDQYAKSAPAGFHIMLDQLEECLAGRTEPFPSSGSENDDDQKTLQEEYEKQLRAM